MSEREPLTIVIFGGTGDLAEKKLIPALFDLYKGDYLPKHFSIVGFSRKDLSDGEYQEFMKKSLLSGNREDFEEFLLHGRYKQGDINNIETYRELKKYLEKLDDVHGLCTSKIFHLAVPPDLYEPVFMNLSESKLSEPCGEHNSAGMWTRILVEKPFGKDKKEAEKLDKLLGDLFEENQVFRIDHYLAKEALQNIITFRFSNAIFESIWNSESIERVDIKLFEKFGIGDRGESYDGVGALMDVGQNHMLQMLALVTMEDPEDLKPDSIRKSRANVLKKLVTSENNLEKFVYRAQYDGYKKEKKVNENSDTETYFKLKVKVDTPKWKDTLFYLENGKFVDETYTEIVVTFRARSSCICPEEDERQHKNILTFRVQPDEGIKILFWAKKPGFGFQLDEKDLSFKYSSIEGRLPDAYERVLFDCIRGDQTLFPSTEEILAQWNFIMPILETWKKLPLGIYKAGSSPEEISSF